MTSSIYASLQDDGREFRLLILEPSTDRLTPVRCKLARTSCDDDDVKYAALSYTWGDRVSKTPILVNEVATQVTIDLEAALRHIRKPSSAMVLWVDAICINQEDLAEKSHQVEMMREIYSGAELVIAWLGSASDDSDLAMNVLGKGFEGWKSNEGNQYESTGEQWLDHAGSSTTTRDREIIHQIGLMKETSTILQLKVLPRGFLERRLVSSFPVPHH